MNEDLRSVLGELHVLSPDVSTAMVMKPTGEILAATEGSTQEQAEALIASLKGLNYAECLGGIENFLIQDSKTQLCVRVVDDVYFAALYSRVGKQPIIRSLTEVIVPTVIRLSISKTTVQTEKPEPNLPIETPNDHLTIENPVDQDNSITEAAEEEIEVVNETASSSESSQPKAPVTQFMVEKMDGILVPLDTVRIDVETINKWSQLYGGRQITTVKIEALDGRALIRKIKPIKNIRTSKKGMIQIPERVMQALKIDAGKLVIAKPNIEEN